MLFECNHPNDIAGAFECHDSCVAESWVAVGGCGQHFACFVEGIQFEFSGSECGSILHLCVGIIEQLNDLFFISRYTCLGERFGCGGANVRVGVSEGNTK